MYHCTGHNKGFVYGVRAAVHCNYYSNDGENNGENFMTIHALQCSKKHFAHQQASYMLAQKTQIDVRNLFRQLPLREPTVPLRPLPST